MNHRIEVSANVGGDHVPGHRYHDVVVTISQRRTGNWSVRILEIWGSCQERDEEHGRKDVTGRGSDLDAAVVEAKGLAKEAGINASYLAQAISQAAEQAEDAVEEAEGQAVRRTQCRRIRLNFDALPEPLYERLLAEFRRQIPDYDNEENKWRWDIVASDEDHPDGDAIFHQCVTPDDDDISGNE